MDTPQEAKYLKESIRYFKMYGGLFLFSIIMVFIVKPILKSDSMLMNLLIGLPIFVIVFLAPIGLYFTLKSYKNKEGFAKIRFRYFIGHLLFCILILFLILSFAGDSSKLTPMK